MRDYNDDERNEKIVNDRKQQRQEAKSNYAKEKIKKTVRTSIMTAVVGSLQDFENFLGEAWRHGTNYNELTPEEQDLRNKWLDTRDSILNRGHSSIRIAEREINKCSISDFPVNKYKTIIKNKGDQNGRR